MWLKHLFLLAFLPVLVLALAATDEIQDADPAQSGYLDNHNLDPATVGSSSFGILWKNAYNPQELWYAKPLVYTPPNHSQLVFLASSMNIIRIVDAINGTLLNSRTVMPPFLQSDIGCTDMPNYIGISGTPVIDPNTNTVYFFAKGYKNGATGGGVINGIYKFYAVDILTLEDKPGFPILIDGHHADNDNTRYFLGGTVLQRPSLTMINGVVVGAFGGHCDLFNYTGMLVAVSTTAGVGVTSLYAMEGGAGAPAATSDYTVQSGGRAGIWQGGMALSTDGNSRLFLATGNGQGHQNGDVPASGRTPMDTLDEVVANFAVSTTGKLTLTDYFEPYEYVSMDAGDRDLGSGGVCLLDPATFYGTGVSQMGVSVGKNGKAYIVNANNLGGFKQGTGGVDNIIQTIIADNSVFGGSGSYPLEGGYLYFTPIGSPTVAYKMGFDGNGVPIFSLAGQSATSGAGRVGIGIPTVTTYQGQAGTGILWVTDPTNGLQAWNAVPVDGVLTPLSIPATGGLNKFIRPAFGDGRVYVSDTNGNVICLGSPVALPLSCTQPVNFGSLSLGSTATQTITCKALIAIKSINGCITGNPEFQCSNSTLPKGPLQAGATFTFPVTWNLTQAALNKKTVLPGVASTNLDIFTTNGVSLYSSILPISLTGDVVSQAAFLVVNPMEVDMGGVVVGSAGATSGLSSAMTVQNVGAQTLTFLGFSWTSNAATGVRTNITKGNFGNGFTSSSFPAVGGTLAPGASTTIPIQFVTNQVGTYSTFVEFWTNGGNQDILLTASAATAQICNISIGATANGPWVSTQPSSNTAMNFGNVVTGTTVSQYIRLCNSGGSAMTVTKSKPPIDAELLAPNAGVDLHEGQIIPVNSCATGQISIVAAPEGVDRLAHTVSDVWVLNTDDVTFGVHDVEITANIVTKQVGPLLGNGSSEYLYLGCYFDGSGPRLLPTEYTPNNNENGICQTTCFENGYKFAGTEYEVQCWCGNTAPSAAKYTAENLKLCSFSCPGDNTQACGGTGTYISIYYDRTKYVPGADSIPQISSSSVKPTTATSTTIKLVSSPTVSSSSTSKITSTSLTKASSSSLRSSTSSLSKIVSLTTTSRTSATPTPTGPVIVQSVGDYHYVGCWTESTTGRALNGLTYANDEMTVEICAANCAGFIWFGVEYARECYCGNDPDPGSILTSADACDFPCMANPYEYCGGPSRLSMYNNITAVVQSSSKSSSGISTIRTSTSSKKISLTSVISSSSKIASSSKSSLTTTTSKIVSSTRSSSTTLKPSSSTLITSAKLTSSTKLSLASSTKSASSTASPTLGIKQNVGEYTYQGCYLEGSNTRALGAASFYNYAGMTLEECSINCAGYNYFGVEYGGECYCGNTIDDPTSVLAPDQADCSFVCPGDQYEYCGAGGRLEMYKKGATALSSSKLSSSTASSGFVKIPSSSNLKTSTSGSLKTAKSTTSSVSGKIKLTSSISKTSTTSKPPSSTPALHPISSTLKSTTASSTISAYLGFTSLGCFADPAGGPYDGHNMVQLFTSDNMTPDLCISAAAAALKNVPATTYLYAGVEYGRECYAGTAAPTPQPASLVGSNACTQACAGNGDLSCGAGNMYNLYVSTAAKITGTGVSQWKDPVVTETP